MTENTASNNKKIAIWLFICCFFVALMVLIGGLTRLTESGLSMVDWKPVTGFIPPISDAEWAVEFEKYQTSPEYKKVNSHMDVADFKTIFWFEFSHRLLGRITGLIFLIPFIFFVATKRLNRATSLKLSGIFILGAIQGGIGWYMVSSGLIDDPRVSPYRLAMHLLSAFAIFAILFWQGLNLWISERKQAVKSCAKCLKIFSLIVTILLFVQIGFGAIVAGLDAGLVYNTFPLMDGEIIPTGLFAESGFRDAFEDILTSQFIHRWFAFIVAFFILAISVKLLIVGNKQAKISAILLLATLIIQIKLGISTLINVVPINLASAHQMVALALFMSALFINYILYKSK